MSFSYDKSKKVGKTQNLNVRNGGPKSIHTFFMVWCNAVVICSLAIKFIHLCTAPDIGKYANISETHIHNELSGRYPVPSFMIIGAQKGGTTALTTYLKKHPLINSRQRKELHFFDSGGKQRDRYLEEFPVTHGAQMTFDATPSYILESTKIIKRIRDICPWVKFIVTLRNPVDRAYSHYGLTYRTIKDQRNITFESYIREDLNEMKKAGLILPAGSNDHGFYGSKDEDRAWKRYIKNRKAFKHQSILARGLYELQLRQWFRYFPRDQFLILNYHDLKENGGEKRTYKKIISFLGLPYRRLRSKYTKEPIFRGKYEIVPPLKNSTKEWLTAFYEPYNQDLAAMLGDNWKDAWEVGVVTN